MVGLWICQHYFEESTRKVEKATNDQGVTSKLISSTATIGYKSMKHFDAIICNVLEQRTGVKLNLLLITLLSQNSIVLMWI